MQEQATLRRWRTDPVAFIREALIDPETGDHFELYPAQERFLREAFTPGRDGRLPFAEAILGAIKKSGKTATAAMAMLYTIVCIGGPYAEGYCVANDFEQAQGRVFQAIVRIIEASPLLRHSAKITANKIEFPSTGATITALASDYAGAAGANPTITVFDELCGYTSERSQRLFDELVPVPTRKISVRLTVTYAGFEGESELLERLYKQGLQGEEIAPSLYRQKSLLMAWHHEPVASWQTAEWIEQMRVQLRPNQFLRMIENRWVTSESNFVELEWWDNCTDLAARPVVADARMPVWLGVDASVKRDSTAIVACTWDARRLEVERVGHMSMSCVCNARRTAADVPLDIASGHIGPTVAKAEAAETVVELGWAFALTPAPVAVRRPLTGLVASDVLHSVQPANRSAC